MPFFYEFFAGGGMARAGLGEEWTCSFANDFSAKKAESYIANWGGEHLRVDDINALNSHDLPGHADLQAGARNESAESRVHSGHSKTTGSGQAAGC